MPSLRPALCIALSLTVVGLALVAPANGQFTSPERSAHAQAYTKLDGELYQIGYSERHRSLWVTSTTHRPGTQRTPATSAIYRIDPGTGAVRTTITPRTLAPGSAEERPEAGYGIAVDDEHNQLWVSATREEAVVVYHQVTGARVATIHGVGHARDIAIDPRRDEAYVSDPINGAITILDTRTLTITDRVAADPVPNFSPMSLELVRHRGRTLLYTVNLEDGALITHDPVHDRTRVVAQTGGVRASGVAVDPRRHRAYVASQSTADLRTIDLETGRVIATVPASGSALNTTVDRVGGRVYTALFTGRAVLVTDADTGARIAEVETGRATHDVAVAAGRIWGVDQDPDGATLWRIRR